MPFKTIEARRAYDKKRHQTPHRQKWVKQYNKKNKRKIALWKRSWREDNVERMREWRINYYKNNPEKFLINHKNHLKKIGKLFDMDWSEMRYALDAWSLTVKKRDSKKCTWCNSTEKLVAHHIWHKAIFPESALDPDNGITLCHECHKEQHRLDRSFN